MFCGNNPVNNVDPLGWAHLWVNGKKFKVETSQEVFDAITSSAKGTGSITELRYRGHTQFGRDLWLTKEDGIDSKSLLTNGEMESFLEKNKNLFSDKAKFYPEGCNTLNPNAAPGRIADRIRDALPNAAVWGFTGLAQRKSLLDPSFVPARRDSPAAKRSGFKNEHAIPIISEWVKMQ